MQIITTISNEVEQVYVDVLQSVGLTETKSMIVTQTKTKRKFGTGR